MLGKSFMRSNQYNFNDAQGDYERVTDRDWQVSGGYASYKFYPVIPTTTLQKYFFQPGSDHCYLVPV